MKTQQYQLRVSGLRENEGQIRMATLRRVMDAIFVIAERTTRLLATGTGSGRGKKPRWLEATIDITVTGLKPGSTVFDLEAPRLGETEYAQFVREGKGSRQPDPDETALDLVAQSIIETQANNPKGDYFDRSVLEAILQLGKAAGIGGVSYKMTPQGTARGRFELDDNTCTYVKERLDHIQAPRSFIVSGRLEEINHGNGRFRLVVDNRSVLFGQLDASLDVEALRSLWGKQTTIEGMVHFKSDGQPRIIEARRISARLEQDVVFEEMPSIEPQKTPNMFSAQRKQAGTFDPIELAGAWPGDEPVEDLLAQLD